MPHDSEEPLDGGGRKAAQDRAGLVPDKRLFNAVQLRLFRYTAVLLSLVALAALIAIVAWALGWILSTFYNLLLSLAVAGILALVLYPVVDFLENRLRLPRWLAIMLLMAIFFLGVGGLMFFFVPTLTEQIVQLLTALPDALARWQDHVTFYFPEITSMIEERLEGGNGEESKSSLEGTGTTVMSYLGILAAISFVPLFLFFALLSGDLLRGKASELLSIFEERTQKKVLYFMDVFVGYITAFFQGQLMIAMIMGALYSLSFTLIGLQYGLLAGLVLGLLNIVPFLGTLIGLLVILPLAYLQPEGGIELLMLTALAFAVVQLIESWWLTPKIMSNRSGLHPALVIISLFFWGTALNGIIGMVLAIPLTAFFVAIWGEIKTSLKHALSSRENARP
ncbi:AI-2E family transporter [Thioalkalivibrio sp. ALMg11]|uniref:AI-2E family transporter n=1 Tax=Thioalkalivibrio sp. ALMg11 TaxID=1158165 RepID=UPI00036DA56C|nr:AI-2E family transporter [Thioalkalivibrio sp. ALMg11]